MKNDNIKERNFARELVFSASCSSGPGGQNVNKVSTRVELRFDVLNSALLTSGEKEIVVERLGNKISNEGILILVSQTERSQLRNKEKVTEKFFLLIEKALTPVKKRKPTRPSMSSVEKRLEKKRMTAEKKIMRKGLHP